MSFVPGQYSTRVQLISSAQNYTASWADLGGEIDTRGFNTVALWLTLDINDSVNARVRALAKHTAGGSEEYPLPIRTVGSSAITIEPEYYEFNTDADQLMVLSVSLDNVIPFVQFQIIAGTAGASPGQIDAAYYSLGY